MNGPTALDTARLEELVELKRRVELAIAEERLHIARMVAIRQQAAARHVLDPQGLIERTLALVADAYQITADDIRGRSRTATVSTARHVVVWLLHKAGLSYPEIGRAIGRTHPTAVHSVQRVQCTPDLLRAAGELERVTQMGAA